MPTVTVVIPHFYQVRRDYIPQMATALNNGTVPPLEILIWNDDVEPFRYLPPHTFQITPHRAIGSKARYLAAMCAKGDYILFHDNDMMVEPGTVEQFLKYAKEDTVLSLEGRQVLNEFHGPMNDRNRLNGSKLVVPTPVDIPHSEISFSSRRLAHKLFSGFPFVEDSCEMDDIEYAAAAKHAGIGRFVIPFGVGQGFIRLEEKGVGMWREKGFYETRDALVRKHWPENFHA